MLILNTLSWLVKSSLFFDIMKIFFIILLSYVHIELLKVLNKIEIPKKHLIVFVTANVITNSAIGIFLNLKTSTFISMLIFPIITYYTQKLSFNRAMHYSNIINVILFIAFAVILKISFINEVALQSLLVTILSLIIECIVILSISSRKFALIDEISENFNRYETVISLGFYIVLIVHILSIMANKEPVLLDILMITLYLFISIINIKCRTNNFIENREIENLKMYNNTLNLQAEGINNFKNDFIFIMENIESYLKSDDYDSLKKYYSSIMSNYNDTNKLSTLDPKVINESAIYNIISNKYYLAQQAGINVDIEVLIDFTKINIKAYELARILGIFLDNAIEASKSCEKKYIGIRFSSKGNKSVIKISNTYNNNVQMNFDSIFLKGFTTKKRNSGLGLWKVKQMLLKHDNLDLYTYNDGDLFCQELSIY